MCGCATHIVEEHQQMACSVPYYSHVILFVYIFSAAVWGCVTILNTNEAINSFTFGETLLLCCNIHSCASLCISFNLFSTAISWEQSGQPSAKTKDQTFPDLGLPQWMTGANRILWTVQRLPLFGVFFLFNSGFSQKPSINYINNNIYLVPCTCATVL